MSRGVSHGKCDKWWRGIGLIWSAKASIPHPLVALGLENEPSEINSDVTILVEGEDTA